MFTILSVQDMRKHFGFWMAMLANSTPIDPLTLPKDLRRMLDKMNEEFAGDKPDAGARCSWACRFTGVTDSTTHPKPDQLREFILCGPEELDRDDAFLIIAGDVEPAEVQEWENGIGLKPWKMAKPKPKAKKAKVA